MNDWMIPKLKWDDSYRPDRGKVLSKAQLEEIQTFYRYLDVDGDEIPYRTLPGVHPKGAYFTRGSGHDKYGKYTEDADKYVEVVDRLKRKVLSAKTKVPAPVIDKCSGEKGPGEAAFGIVSLGGCDAAVREAVATYRASGVAVDYLRVRAFPFADEVEAFLRSHENNYVIEQNRDGQLHRLLLLETGIERDRITSVVDYGGVPMSKQTVMQGIQRVRGNGDARASTGRHPKLKGAQA